MLEIKPCLSFVNLDRCGAELDRLLQDTSIFEYFLPSRRLNKIDEAMSSLITKLEYDIMPVRISLELEYCAAHRSLPVGGISVERF